MECRKIYTKLKQKTFYTYELADKGKDFFISVYEYFKAQVPEEHQDTLIFSVGSIGGDNESDSIVVYAKYFRVETPEEAAQRIERDKKYREEEKERAKQKEINLYHYIKEKYNLN